MNLSNESKLFVSLQSDPKYKNRSVPPNSSSWTSSRHNYSRFKQAGDHGGYKGTGGGKHSGSQNSLLRIDSTESLDETDMRRTTHSPAMIRRTVSMDGLNRPWRHDSEEDLRSKKSSVSIAVSSCFAGRNKRLDSSGGRSGCGRESGHPLSR